MQSRSLDPFGTFVTGSAEIRPKNPDPASRPGDRRALGSGTVDLADVTIDTFAGRVGETFTDGETGDELELVSADAISAASAPATDDGRTPFSLMFRGGDTLVEQSIRTLAHDELGELAIFLVPVAREAGGYVYQAVFT